MKKFISILMMIMVVFTICSCEENIPTPSETIAPQIPSSPKKNALFAVEALNGSEMGILKIEISNSKVTILNMPKIIKENYSKAIINFNFNYEENEEVISYEGEAILKGNSIIFPIGIDLSKIKNSNLFGLVVFSTIVKNGEIVGGWEFISTSDESWNQEYKKYTLWDNSKDIKVETIF